MTGAGLLGLAEEQAALRRVATLVARGTPPEEVFASVTEEVARLFPTDWTVMCRYVPDGAFTIVGSVGSLDNPWPVGGRWPLGGNNAATLVFETARPARIENYAGVSGAHIDQAREDGIRSTVGVPIIVEGRVWGLMGVVTICEEPLPAGTYSGAAGNVNAITVENKGGFNGARAPGYFLINTRVAYRWRLNNNRSIQAHFDIFNLTNHANP